MPDDPPLHTPQDRFFRDTFSQPDRAADFFRNHVPSRLAAEIEWSTLELQAGSFLDAQLTGQSSDLLYRVRCRGSTLYLYCLFEHQSTVDPDMPFRLLRYMVRIWEAWRRTAKPGERPPAIVPMVLHQGPERWHVSTRFFDWLKVPAELAEELAPMQPDFTHLLVDLSQMPLESIRGELIVRLTLSAMKAVRDDRLLEWAEKVSPMLDALLEAGGESRFFYTLFRYVFDAAGGPETDAASTLRELAVRVTSERVQRDVMSIAEALRQEGRQEGREEGLQRGTLIGRIQHCQELLGVRVQTVSELEQQPDDTLQSLWRELEARVRNRLR